MTEISDEPAEPFESEAEFIRFLTRICSSSGMTVDFTDDCAQLDTFTDLVSTDTIIAGQHLATNGLHRNKLDGSGCRKFE